MYNDSADKISARPYHDYRAVKIEDADVFVAICPHSWSRPNPFAIQLFSGENREKLIYRVAIDPSASRTFRTIAFGRNPLKSEDCDVVSCEDRNMIVRIVKTTKEFKTYINGHYIQPTGSCDILQADDRKITGMSFNVDSQLFPSETALIHRWISSSSDPELMGRIEALANYMKNPFDSLWALILEREEEKEEVEKNEMAIVDEIERLSKLRKASDDEKTHLTMLKQSWDEMFRHLETSFLERERILGMVKRPRVDDAEKDAGTGTGTGGDGTDRPSGSYESASTAVETSARGSNSNSTRGLNVNPPDAEYFKLSSTIAWPQAVKHILGAAPFDDIQKRHEQLMSSWVVSRGDNISFEAYDYLMYSQCMGWPKVVLEASSKGELARVRARCEEIMNVLV